MIWTSDMHGGIVHGCEEWAKITGQPVPDALGDGWQAMVHPDDLPRILPVFKMATRSKSPFVMQYRLQALRGGFVWVVSGAVPSLGAPNEEFLGFLGSLTEIEAGAEPSEAGGWIGVLKPPSPHEDVSTSRALDLIADHLLRAHSLTAVCEECGPVLQPLRQVMLSVAVELARRSGAMVKTRH